MQERIEQTLNQQIKPDFLEVINESYKHNVPTGAESHFKVTMVTDKFNGLSRIARHKLIYANLGEIVKKIHALSLGLFTPEEWQARAAKPHYSPDCERRRT